MLQVQMHDLTNGSGTKTGLPKSLLGGMRLNTQEMPVCAAGRRDDTAVFLSYPLARGCVKLLQGELANVELVGRQGDSQPSGIHLVLANGTSHAWVLTGDAPDGSGKALWLRGMPFSSQLFNYNGGIAIGLHMMQHAAAYPEFASAVGKAIASTGSGEQYAQAVALMADEMAYAVERMLDGTDPGGIGCVLMDREQPADLDAVFDGGRDLKETFTSPDSLRQFADPSTSSTSSTTPGVPFTPSFVGDLPNKLVDCIRRGKHVLLTGPTATGKTRCVQEVTSYLGCPTSYIGGCEGLEDRDIIGSVCIENGNTRFVYGPLSESLVNGRKQAERWLAEQELAKREDRGALPVPPAVLLVDEVNRLQSRFQNVFVTAMNVRPVTDDYYFLVPDTGEQLTCPVGFWVMIAARNVGSNYTSTNSMDLALERRFFKKIDLDYLQPEAEADLVRSRTGLAEDLTKVLIKTASDTRYQLSQLKAPLDTDTALKWAEELAYIQSAGGEITSQVLLDTARDIVFDICLERSERGGFDQAGEAVLTDNISENWRDRR